MVKLFLRKITAAHPGANPATARVHGQKAGLKHRRVAFSLALPVGQLLQLRKLPVHRLVGQLLKVGVQRGAHPQTIGMNVVALAVCPANQPFAQVLRHMRRWANRLDLTLEVKPQRTLVQRFQASRIQLAMLGHLRQHQVTSFERPLRVLHRVVITGAFEHANQSGAFQYIELVGRLVEISPGGHFNAEGVVQKWHGIEVGFKNLGLGINRLDFQRGNRLLDFAGDGGSAANFFGVQVARQLLGDG